MATMDSSEPWYLTIVSTQGIQFPRGDRSWRPIVCVSVEDHTHETVLGCDGRNPNLKVPFELREVHHDSRIEIKVWHQSRTKKSKRKKYLVGSTYLTLGDIIRRQDSPKSNIPINLKCPPANKRSPNLGSTRQLNCAMILVRLASPPSPSASRTATLVASSHASDCEDCACSYDSTFSSRHDSPPGSPLLSTNEDDMLLEIRPKTGESVLMRRRKRVARRKLKGYCLNTSDEGPSEGEYESVSDSEPPSTPQGDHFLGVNGTVDDDSTWEDIVIAASCDNDGETGEWGFYAPRSAITPLPQPFSRAERCVDSIAPYSELSHPQCDFGKVLGRVLTEWYAVGGCLLATAALNAAVFGYSSSSDILFAIDGLALRSVTVGSIASGIGLVIDAWFLMLYSSGDVERFKRRAADFASSDSDPTFFYFSLACRLPAMCLLVSAVSLMLFLLTVAWMAWPTAVLVMCFGTGMLLTLQYLVFGMQRVMSCLLRAGRLMATMGRRRKGKRESERISIPPINTGQSGDDCGSPSGNSETLPPPPYSSPPMPSQELNPQDRGEENDLNVEFGPSVSRRP